MRQGDTVGQGQPLCWPRERVGHRRALLCLSCLRWSIPTKNAPGGLEGVQPVSTTPFPNQASPPALLRLENITKMTSFGRRSPSPYPAPCIFQVGFSNVNRHTGKKGRVRVCWASGPGFTPEPSGILHWLKHSKECLFYPFPLALSPCDLRPLYLSPQGTCLK